MLTANLLRKPYFADRQFQRMLTQLLACFAGYQVMTGLQRDGEPRFLDVPIIYGDMERTAAYILHGGSQNTMSYIPIMSLFMTGIKQKADWRQNPQHFEKFRYVERQKDADGNFITGVPGKRKTVERYQPVPYDVGVELSIWSSNSDQAFQILEQILVVFNPEVEIQLSNSPADWSFVTPLIFSGEVVQEKVVPEGKENDPFYVNKLTFNTVLWLSPPARVYETKHIHRIVVPIKELEDSLDFDSMTTLDGLVIQASDEDIIRFEGSLEGKNTSSDTEEPD